MESTKQFEVFGTLTKIEKVFSINEKCVPGSLVFEALKPFPGYYSEAPFDESKLLYLYLALNDHYPLEEIIRVSKIIEKDFQEKFDAGKGFIRVFDEKYNVLRIRHLHDYDLIQELQQRFAEHGIHYLSKSKKYVDAPAQITIVKFLSLELLGEGIYLDLREANHGYIEIPKYLGWNEFEELVNRVKYNWLGSKFDAAKGAFYYKGELHEFVRIYSSKVAQGYLSELRELFLEKIR